MSKNILRLEELVEIALDLYKTIRAIDMAELSASIFQAEVLKLLFSIN